MAASPSPGGLSALWDAYSLSRRSVLDDVTGNPLITSSPTGEVRQRSSILPLGRDDDGRLVPAVPQMAFDAIDALRYPGQVARGEASIWDPSTGHVSDQALERASGLAGLAMTGSMPFKAPAGAVRSFGGAAAKDDPLAALEAALAHLEPEPAPPGPRRIDPSAPSWDLYHGSTPGPDFPRFDPAKAGNPAEQAVFFAPNSETASGYAGVPRSGAEAGSRVYRATVDPGRTAVFDLAHLAETDPAFNARARAITETHNPANAPLFDDYMSSFRASRAQDQDIARQAAEMGYSVGPDAASPVSYGYGHIGAAIERAKQQGLDTAVLRNLAEHGRDDQVVALTPGRVRSYYDPSQVLYSGGPSSVLAGAAAALVQPSAAQASGPYPSTAPASKGSPMSSGLAFDPAEFAAFKAGRAPAPETTGGAPNPAADVFDPAEFASFKASRSGGQRQPVSFDERFGSGPTSATVDTSTPEGSALRRTADEMLIGKPSLENQIDAGLFRGANAMGLNLPRNAMAGIEALRSGKSFDRSYRDVQDIEDALARQYPKTAMAGTVGGIVGGAFALPPIGRVADVGRVGQAALSGAGYGFLGEAADNKDLGRAAQAGLVGGALGGVGGAIIDKAAPVVSRLFAKNAPFRTADGALTDEASAALRGAGIDPAMITPEIEAAFRAKGPSAGAAREAAAAEFGLPLSRGQATGDPRALALEGRALAGQTGPRAQQIGEDFAARQADAMAAARDRFQGMAAGTFDRIDNPQQAYEAVADRARQAAQAEAERVSIAQRGQDDALRALRGRGETDTLDGATAAAQGVRDAAEQGRAAYRSAYGDVGQIPGAFVPGAMDRVGTRVRGRLGAEVPIDDVLTPAASRAIGDLDNVPGLFGLQPGEGPDLQQIEQLRKRLVSYRGSTGQNPTDRRAVDRILSEFDGHVEDAMGAGLFGPRQAPRAAAEAADGFPGAAGLDGPPAPFPAAGRAPAGRSEPLTHYLARNGGIALDGDARAGDLGRVMTPYGPLGRKSGRPIEDFRDQLASEGFIRPDSADGMISRRIGDEVHDLIGIERGGNPVYRLSDISRGGAPADAGGRIADQSAVYAERLAPFRQQVADDLAAVGVDRRHVDPAHLDDAAGRLFRREHETGTDAYEAAVMGHPAGESRRTPAPGADAVPFDGPTSVPTSDALPIGDTGPAEAMRRARGLFRDYKQAFSPRGPGDTAGNNLRRIVERDASPNEVASMLFGSTTGRVSSGQIQTLTRLREAVGADSEPWQAVQRALVARHLGGEGRDLGQRLDYLLRGEGRSLTPFLSQEQRAGLGRLRAATTQAQNTGQAMPAWVSDLERSGFDPNTIGRSIFGSSGAIGARPGAALEAQAAKAFLGGDSQEWAMLRQAAVHRLTDPSVNAGKTIERLRDFTDGAGKGVASALFGPEELGSLRRFAGALVATARPGAARGQEMSGPAAKALAKAVDVIAGMVAFKVGGLPAAAGTYGAKVGQRAIMGGVGAAAARRSFEGGAPRVLTPPPMLPLGQIATGEGLALGQ